jgi:hypothetical protein
MSTDILLSPVGEDQRLGSATFRLATNNNNGIFTYSDNTVIPSFGTNNFAILCNVRAPAGSGNQSVVSFYKDTSNYLQIFHASGDTTLRFRLRIDNTERVSVSIPRAILGLHTPILCCRNGTTWGIYALVLDANGQPTLSKDEDLGVDLAALGADKIGTNIADHANGRMYYGSWDGSTTSTKWQSALGSIHIAICDPGTTLTDHNLATDAEKIQLLLDHQRLFSACDFNSEQVTSYGDWCDSSGNRKIVTKETQLAANDRLVCPITGKYLVLAAGAASADALGYPPYHMPCNKPGVTARGSWSQLCSPQAVEYAGGWLVSMNQVDSAFNPLFFGAWLGPDGEPNRWPIPVYCGFPYEDSSDGGAWKIWYNTLPNITRFGDTHTEMSVIKTDDAVIFAPFGHSNTYSNSPATGDTLYSWPVYCVWDDEGPELLWPITVADSPAQDSKTYSVFSRYGGKVLESWRGGSGAGGHVMVTQTDEATRTLESVKVISNVGTRHNYIGWHVEPFSDGRRLITGFVTNHDNNYRFTHWGVIAPRVTDDFDLNTNWFSLTGQALDGASGRPLLGSFTLSNNPTFHLLDDNDSFLPNLPADSIGMDFIRMEKPCRVTGTWEGIAAIVRVSAGNGDRSLSETLTSGSVSDPWTSTTIRRWEYDSSTPSLTFRDSFDITDILETLNPGNWPQNTNLTTGEAAHLECMQIGPNKMLMFVNDPESVAVGASLASSTLGCLLGFTLKAVIFNKMNADDPTQYVELVDAVFTLPTDNSEGYGLYPFAIGANGVLISIIGGDYDATGTYGNRIVKAATLELPSSGGASSANIMHKGIGIYI